MRKHKTTQKIIKECKNDIKQDVKSKFVTKSPLSSFALTITSSVISLLALITNLFKNSTSVIIYTPKFRISSSFSNAGS